MVTPGFVVFKKMHCPYLQFVVMVMCLSCLDCLVISSNDPLILTPYLNTGMIKEAQEKALVIPDMNRVKSYSGFFTVNEECGNNLFFWFLPAETSWESAPVLLWLNGGPGASSLIGMFTEIGLFNHRTKGFINNEYSWTKDNNVIFLDQPVGSGFSFTKQHCYSDNMTMVGREVYTALIQFFTLFPNLQENKFFFTGESYAGHYIPAIATEIHLRNDDASLKINMIGFVIGDPAIDDRCLRYGLYLYELGIIDEKIREEFIKYEEDISKLIDEKNYTGAFSIKMPEDNTDLPNPYNVLFDETDQFEYALYIRSYSVRKQIHVGYIPYFILGDLPYEHLMGDYFKPSTPYIEEILTTNKYIVGFYAGQLDMVCHYTHLPCVLQQLIWPGISDYLTAARHQWWVDGWLAGWYKTTGNLFEAVFRNAGHLVPRDQGCAALDLIRAVTADNPGSQLLTKLKTEP